MKGIITSLIFLFALITIQAQPSQRPITGERWESLLCAPGDGPQPVPLNQVLDAVAERFGIKYKLNTDTAGYMVNYAASRFRPYSVEETLHNILVPLDLKAWDLGKGTWRIKAYEYPRRYDEEGRKMVDYLNSLYSNLDEWQPRSEALRQEVRQRLGIDTLLNRCVDHQPILSKPRKYDGYTVQNIALELMPGYYVCGSIYAPSNTVARKTVAQRTGGKGERYPLIICPIGHWADGRYNRDLQVRYATLARMGCICITYDLYGWGESELQVGLDAHRTAFAHLYQALCGVRLLDYALTRKDVDPERVATNGGSGGGTHAVLLAVIDRRVKACCAVVSVCSHFDGGCPCESGMPIQYSQGGTCNIELAATLAPMPLMVVGDEGDWTHTYPTIEVPYLKRIYGFYGAEDQVQHRFLPGEKHDFNANKRQAVYDFFTHVWSLPIGQQDESKATIESYDKLFCFGGKQNADGQWIPTGETAPENFVRVSIETQ